MTFSMTNDYIMKKKQDSGLIIPDPVGRVNPSKVIYDLISF